MFSPDTIFLLPQVLLTFLVVQVCWWWSFSEKSEISLMFVFCLKCVFFPLPAFKSFFYTGFSNSIITLLGVVFFVLLVFGICWASWMVCSFHQIWKVLTISLDFFSVLPSLFFRNSNYPYISLLKVSLHLTDAFSFKKISIFFLYFTLHILPSASLLLSSALSNLLLISSSVCFISDIVVLISWSLVVIHFKVSALCFWTRTQIKDSFRNWKFLSVNSYIVKAFHMDEMALSVIILIFSTLILLLSLIFSSISITFKQHTYISEYLYSV